MQTTRTGPEPATPAAGTRPELASGARTRPCSLTVNYGDAQGGAVMSPALSGAPGAAGARRCGASAVAPAARTLSWRRPARG